MEEYLKIYEGLYMKKIITMILSALMALSVGVIAGCKDPEGTTELTRQVTKEEWVQATQIDAFNNTTFNFTVIGNAQMGNMYSTIKFANDKVYGSVKLSENGEVEREFIYENQMAQDQKNDYLNNFVTLLEKYEDFTYDLTDKVYEYTGVPIVSTSEEEIATGFTRKIVLETKSINVKFDQNGRLSFFSASKKETTYVNGAEQSYKEFTNEVVFTDYGNTIIKSFQTNDTPNYVFVEIDKDYWNELMLMSGDRKIDCKKYEISGNLYTTRQTGEILVDGNIVKSGDIYCEKGTFNTYLYLYNENSQVWEKVEADEKEFNSLASFVEFSNLDLKFNSISGLYEDFSVTINEDLYLVVKFGFVEGKLAYVYYEKQSDEEIEAEEYVITYADQNVILPMA